MGKLKYGVRIENPVKFSLKSIPTDSNGGLEKHEAEKLADELGKKINELEDLLFFAGTHSVLIILQGMDTSGKDGTIRELYSWMNGQSSRVAPFKVPTEEELAHDFLWRVHQKVPRKGEWVMFNRSHYEDVLVVRVHQLVPKTVWEPRYARINEFENLVQSANTIVVKLFLHISKEEQEERLRAREEETEKAWKLSVGDWKERELWDDYQAAYQDVLTRCSPDNAPWTVIPADHKWFRDLAVAEALCEALEPYREDWMAKLKEVGAKAKAELAEYRSSG